MTVARFDTLRSLAFGSITGSYQPLGGAILNQWRSFKLTNTCNQNMLISFDGGINDNIILPANSFVLYDIATNANQDAAQALTLSIGTQFSIKAESILPSVGGSVYLEGFYQRG